MSRASLRGTEGRGAGRSQGSGTISAFPRRAGAPRLSGPNQKPTSKKRVTAGIDSTAVPASQIQSETSVVVLAPENRS